MQEDDKTEEEQAAPQKKKKSGKLFVPTEQQRIVVRTLRSVGVTLPHVALSIIDPNTGNGISIPTLKKAFPDELENGKLFHLARIYNSLSNQALAGSVKACLAILVAQAPEEWGFTKHLRLAAGEGAGKTGEVKDDDLESMTDEELEEIARNYEAED